MQATAQQVVETSPEQRERRKRRVAEVTSESLSTLPRHLSRLDGLLRNPPVDLARVASIVSADPEFCDLLLSLTSTELFNAESCSVTVPQAIVLFGSERLRTLALTCAFLKYSGRNLPISDRRRLWHHSFLTATLSDRTARQVAYAEPAQAYLGGLLHDIGQLPLLIVAFEDEAAGDVFPAKWLDDPSVERELFGMDHCKIGRSIAAAWNLAASLADAIEHHHLPFRAKRDANLAEIVAGGDRYSNLLSPNLAGDAANGSSRKAGAVNALLQLCVPPLWRADRKRTVGLSRSGDLGATATIPFVH